MSSWTVVLQDDVSGDYRELLMALIGERQSDVAPEEEEPEEQEMEEVEEEVVPVSIRIEWITDKPNQIQLGYQPYIVRIEWQLPYNLFVSNEL